MLIFSELGVLIRRDNILLDKRVKIFESWNIYYLLSTPSPNSREMVSVAIPLFNHIH